MEGPVTETSLAPGLLLAMPHLVDPNFTRAVVLMIEHNDEGSFGLVINQPSEMDAAELLAALDIEWRGEKDARVWSGGPVMPTSGWVLHEPTPVIPEPPPEAGLDNSSTVRLMEGICLSTSPDNLKAIAEDPPERIRLLLGYSGWGPGQLAGEMARGSWLHADLTPGLVFDTPPDDIWEAALRSLGVNPDTIVQSRGIH
jgi:putative transcriptional regulator